MEGRPVDEEAVLDQASAGGSGLCGRALDGDERLHGGGDEPGVGVVAYLRVNELHHNIASPEPLESEVDTGGSHGGVGIVVEDLRDEALRLGLTHGNGPTILDPVVGGGVVGPLDEREFDAAYVGGGRLDASQEGALLDDHLGTRQVDGVVVGVNDELDHGHGGH